MRDENPVAPVAAVAVMAGLGFKYRNATTGPMR